MYLYEMHQHLSLCSACGQMKPQDAIRELRAHGYAGAVLTDHFFHGNTAVRRQMPWTDFVRAYEKAYLLTKEIGEQWDFDVLFGIEEAVGDGKEVLVYGITPQVLYEHPELRRTDSLEENLIRLADIVHEAGGLLYQAHPFRVRNYIRHPWEPLPADLIDGIEVCNANNNSLEDARAVAYANRLELPRIAGSDSHVAGQEERYGILSPHRLRTNEDLIDTLCRADYELYIPDV